MIPTYNNSRRCIVCFVDKALKDNKVCKKGESYIWVKKTNFSPKEFFKNEEELDKYYPKYFDVNLEQLNLLLKDFKKELKQDNNIKIKEYLINKFKQF